MKLTTGQRAAMLIQGRLGEIPLRGTMAFERWICAQHAGRVYLTHVWDCQVCNPEGLPPERLTTQHCHRGDLFFTEAMIYRSALVAETGGVSRSRIHKKWSSSGATDAVTSGHLAPLIRA